MAKTILKYMAVVCCSILLSFFVQFSGNFPDPDSFYHAGVVSIIGAQGIPHEFPWLQFTALKENYVDHHLLYHLIAVPLLKYFNPLHAVRVLSFVFAALAVAAFFYIQERKKMRAALLSTGILVVTSTFLFRINLSKGVAPVLVIFFLLLWAIIGKKEKTAFVLSAIYPWLYAGWPLAPALALVYMFAAGLSAGTVSARQFFAAVFSRSNLRMLAAVLGGISLGIVTNPYFPDNLWFTWMQAVKIGLINYQGSISVGQEWYPVGYGDFLSGTALLAVFFMAAIVLFFVAIQKGSFLSKEVGKRMAQETIFFAILAGIFFVLTLKSRRSAEYFIPLSLLTSSWLVEAVFLARPQILREARDFFCKSIWRKAFVVYVALAALFIAARDVNAIKKYFDKGFTPEVYRAAAAAISANSSPKDLVFHIAWDEFPMLFYWNRSQYYIAGLDPTFFYDFDPDLYNDWYEVANGRYGGDLVGLISGKFKARIVFVSSRYPKFRSRLKEDSRFELIYDDKDSSVFKVR